MNKEKILSCPFCGKDADFFEEEWMISCMDSEGSCGFFYNGEGYEKKELIEAWNTRARPEIDGEKIEVIIYKKMKDLYWDFPPLFLKKLPKELAKALVQELSK